MTLRKHIKIVPDEIDDLEEALTCLRRVLIFTRSGNGKKSARLDRSSLKTILAECDREYSIFICGPAKMMMQIRTDLKAIGFTTRSIFMKRFGH